MSKTILFHSFHHGVGRSNLAANLAHTLASQGKRVAIIDTDTRVPALHKIFGLQDHQLTYTLNDFLQGNCNIEQTVVDLSSSEAMLAGQLWLVPANVSQGRAPKELSDINDAELLNIGCQALSDHLALDAILLDTHPGVTQKALLAVTLADILVIILRLNQSDYHGTGVAIEVMRQLDIPKITLMVNEVPTNSNIEQIKAQMSQAFQCDVALVLPHLDEMMTLANQGLFIQNFPDHPATAAFNQAGQLLLAEPIG